MDRIRRLQGSIQNYAWGSKTALAEFSGRPTPTDEPEAELWMGAHPSAPSLLTSEEATNPDPQLDEWIARDPLVTLGEATSERFGGKLPFLFKVLAPDRALSIQAHPDRAQARAGFDRENAAGLSASAPDRSYRDPNPKPELICALTRFNALCGFRDAADIQTGLERLEIGSLGATLQALESGGIAAGFRALLETDVATQREIAETTRIRAATFAGDPPFALVSVLAEQYPGDIGVLAPIWMRLISLEPGQALFLEAGEIHSYVSGVGIELMGNSDNVLRGGLTAKHVNVPELCETLTFAQTAPRVLSAEPEKAGDGSIYRTSAEEFVLRVFNVSDKEPIERNSTASSAEIWLCSAGSARLTDKRYETTLELARGEAAWIPASAGPHRVEGSGVFHVASVGPTP
ncbi:MAG: mannose-6-phosphate isomerase, class I [Myxococcota bacterium]|nr:mannose-6-phosphate isomerase, class I [Myxococcota bacterium]